MGYRQPKQCSCKKRALIIAAPGSGSGKTTVALGLMRALVNKGMDVQPYKSGPDYIDSLWHADAAGRKSYNLDTWMVRQETLYDHFYTVLNGHDIGIIEGAMGLYDGFEGSIEGSTAQIAVTLDVPVILVVNCKGVSGSVAPLVCGFRDFNKSCRIAGVICNNAGSAKHKKYLYEALKAVDINVLGCIYRNENIKIKSRHLGLTFSSEQIDSKIIDKLADMVSNQIDLGSVISMSEINCPYPEKNRVNSVSASVCRIAVAYDKAFNFYYQANLDMLVSNGVEIVYFSPLDDSTIPENIQGIYLGGGYPEEYAEQLSANSSMRKSILEFSRIGGCIFAECGGYMYLGKYLKKNGKSCEMCGVFDCGFIMADRKRKTLGYREAVTNFETLLGPEGLIMRGHEFHYSRCEKTENGSAPFTIKSRNSNENEPAGSCMARTLGSYLHIHFLSCPEAAKNFVRSCEEFRQGCSFNMNLN